MYVEKTVVNTTSKHFLLHCGSVQYLYLPSLVYIVTIFHLFWLIDLSPRSTFLNSSRVSKINNTLVIIAIQTVLLWVLTSYLFSIHLGLSRVPTHRVLWYLYSSAPLDRPPKMGYRIFVQQNSSIVKLKWRHQQQTDANLDKVFRYFLGLV